MKCQYRNLPPPPHTLCIDFSWICLTGMCTLVKICQKDRKQLKTEYSTCTTPTFLIVNTGIQKINSKNNLQFHLFTPNRLIKNLQFVKRHGNHLFHSLNYNEVSFFDEFYDYLRTTSDFDHNFRGRIWWIVML